MRKLLGMLIEWLLSYEHVVRIRRATTRTRFSGALDFRPALLYKKYPGDAGYDLAAVEDLAVPPGQFKDVPTGVFFDPRSRIWFEIKARSSTLRIHGLEVIDAVIDRGYRGEMKVQVRNPGRVTVFVKQGDRLAQVIPHLLVPVRFKDGELGPSDRGECGFGSTGR